MGLGAGRLNDPAPLCQPAWRLLFQSALTPPIPLLGPETGCLAFLRMGQGVSQQRRAHCWAPVQTANPTQLKRFKCFCLVGERGCHRQGLVKGLPKIRKARGPCPHLQDPPTQGKGPSVGSGAVSSLGRGCRKNAEAQGSWSGGPSVLAGRDPGTRPTDGLPAAGTQHRRQARGPGLSQTEMQSGRALSCF